MPRLIAYSAVLTRRIACLDGLTNVRVRDMAEPVQRTSPAATYAIEAMSLLDVPRSASMYAISGPSSASVEYFAPVKNRATDGQLMGRDLAERLKRLHPYALLIPLQNQVPASLSMHFGLTGPCTNLIDSTTAFSDALPALELARNEPVSIIVLSSAGDRPERQMLNRAVHPGRDMVEGAICFCFGPSGRLGMVQHVMKSPAFDLSYGAPDNESDVTYQWPYAACLQGGIGLLWALASRVDQARFRLADGGAYETFFEWQRL